jgi:hypothetical protein
MCALTKTMLTDHDAADAPTPSPVNFHVLRDLARLDGQQHGTLLGTSAATALLLQELVTQVQLIAAEIAAMKIGDPPPAGSGAATAAAKPAVPVQRFGVVAAVDPASIQAIATQIGAALAVTIQHPLAEIRGTLKTQGESVAKLDAAQAADSKRLDTLEPQAAALQTSVDALQKRLDRLDQAVILSGHQLLKLHRAVGGLSGDVAGLAELTEAVQRHVELLDVVVEAEVESKDDPPAPRPTSGRKSKH